MPDWLVRYFESMVRYDDDEAVFQRPYSLRSALSLFAAISIGICLFLVHLAIARPVYRHDLIRDEFVMLLIAIIFCTGAGPYDMRFDFRQRRYAFRWGFPFLSWTRSGDFSEISHLAVWSQRSTGLTVEWKDRKRFQTKFFSCDSVLEARVIGNKLGDSLGVPVEDGKALGLIQTRK